ncbi:hypothetical protein SBV1_2590021 [Verrucomicrobia bacterium]|nr:hypothetical protein SBV1_2590021 [Verrucomicrobiota bacterium]
MVGPDRPQTPLHWSASAFDRRGARAGGHAARPPARFTSLLSQEPDNQNQSGTVEVRLEKVPNLFQDLTKIPVPNDPAPP